MEWFERLPAEGVGVGRVQDYLEGGGVVGLIRGHCPGFACNNYYYYYFFLLDKGADAF